MDLHEAMRTTFSAREFTDEPLPDETIHRLLDVARFAPNGGNRQGWHVIVVRDAETRAALAAACERPAKRYTAQRANGEQPWNTVEPPRVDAATIAATPAPRIFTEPLLRAPVVLVVCVDLRVVASLDAELDRVGIISGASIYPFAWNILLAARAEGYGGTLTTMPIAEEPALRPVLGIPDYVAICAVIPMGRPVRQLTRLRRAPVESFTHVERWDGPPLEG